MNLFKRDNIVQLPGRSRIEALIDEIDQFGYLTLYRSDVLDGWRAYAERKHRGAEVKCSAERGNHKTPVDALESLAKVIRGLK